MSKQKYRVYMRKEVYFETIIEASSEEEAELIASETELSLVWNKQDGSESTHISSSMTEEVSSNEC